MHNKLTLAACLALILVTASGGFPWLLEMAMQLFTGCPNYLLLCDAP